MPQRPMTDSMDGFAGRILVVDDIENNRDLLTLRLELQGHTVLMAEDGKQALQQVKSHEFDLIMLDIMMPEMDGFEVLERLKKDASYRHIPVIMISALDDLKSIVKCIEMGAEDYVHKPFNGTLLKARVTACLEKKRWRDTERKYLKQLRIEQEKSERLLLNVLPKPIADQLKAGHETIADDFSNVTVLFSDIVNFTSRAATVKPIELVARLNEIFSVFDDLANQFALEKIKTVGDEYMVVGGVPTNRDDHAEAVAEMALQMQQEIGRFTLGSDEPLTMRIGIHSGPVTAGVIGKNKFIYDLWGDTVNIASRMESSSVPGKIQVSEATCNILAEKYQLQERGLLDIKGKGQMLTSFLIGKKQN